MQRCDSLPELRNQISAWRQQGARIGFVPTMGNLHAGHLKLVEVARSRCDRLVATIFVNPLQFGPNEDFANYPRTLEEDSGKLQSAGCDLLFAPPQDVVYPSPLEQLTQVSVPGLNSILCGVSRPVHFDGVATVVTKLFNMVFPDVAYFGEKDFQQVVVIRRMVADLNFPIEIVSVPTVREPDGLAMSSRNSYLSSEERIKAPQLYRVLQESCERLKAGESDFGQIEIDALAQLRQAGFTPIYFSIRCPNDLAEPNPEADELVILAAAELGVARLIDNIYLSLKQFR